MKLSFTKMQGCGNDYLYFDCFQQALPDPAALARRLSDRHFGVGGDGLILICPSDKADFRMAMYNADGSEGSMCGNGIRCVAKFVYDKGLTDKTTLNIEQMDLLQQIEQVESVISEQAHQRNQEFRVVTTSVQHEHVLADPNRLNQILMNILSNSVKYTPAGGHIRLEVEELPRDAHYAKYKFIVQDDGIGMSDAYQKTIFDPFTREEKSGTNHVQGTGLGMAITKSVVDLMGGVISVESAPGQGSRFEVVLEFPIDAEADTVQEAQVLPEEEENASPLSGMKFLCAEDNEINSEILQMLLESKGATCKIYPDGQQIVDAFAKVKPGAPASTS